MPEIRIELAQVGPSTSEAAIRSHHTLIDRPVDKGGADEGPMGGELLLAALGGCFLSNLYAAARARETPLEGVRAEVTGTLEGTPPRFVRINVALSADGSAENLEKLSVIAEKGCIVANTLKPAVEIRVAAG